MTVTDIEALQQSLDAEWLVRAIIARVGDDPQRDGVKDTPKRVVESWKELFRGYKTDVPALFKTFGDHEKYDGIVLCRGIEFMSTCEHHMLPFVGTGHIAYLPGEHVIGLSKLARVLDAFARRLQMQERLGQEVVLALDKHLKPRGSACILKAKHLCMMCRGVNKQHSEMVTSSVSGVFRDDPAARAELLALISL